MTQVELVEQNRIDAIKESIYQLEADLDEDDEIDMRACKRRTRHSLRQMKNEFMKKTRFPYLVKGKGFSHNYAKFELDISDPLLKVMGAPTQLSEGQLRFERGEHVIVTDCIGMSQRDGQKWFFGEHTG